ncbi:class I SAM-dependent methyltransferase [candidate division WOR-3 bacterium]|nr:class I SAM-dependent methyltransferase [candidate division WOR-3 bacterium]
MRPDKGKPYYSAYDKRYKSVYSQGVDYWSSFPEVIEGVITVLTSLLPVISTADNMKLIELGCGEGCYAGHISKMGIKYTGLDISETAVSKAKKRFDDRKIKFISGDMTVCREIKENAFDFALDISSLHMLVVDQDRNKYLSTVERILKPGGRAIFLNESYRENSIKCRIETYEQWLSISGTDVDSSETRKAFQNGLPINIDIPRIACRPKSKDQYRDEILSHGFKNFTVLSHTESSISFTAIKGKNQVQS